MERVYIDGSHGEGGGQILRTCLALASMLQLPVTIENIRATRKKPGLKTQHLAGVLGLAKIADAEVKGARLHATRLEFTPHVIRGGRYRFEISTAGAACMLLGAVLPPLLFAPEPSEVTITGGTHVPFSPPFDYLAEVFLPTLARLGGEVSIELVRYGFYPKGGGEIRARIKPCKGLRGVLLKERGPLQTLQLTACSANLPSHIAGREISQMEGQLHDYKEKIQSSASSCQSLSPGNFVSIKARYDHTVAGFNNLGKKGKPAEEVAHEACREFLDFEVTAATIDRHLADQLILYMALAKGESCFITPEITGHLATNIDIIQKFIPAGISVDTGSGQVHVTGAAFTS